MDNNSDKMVDSRDRDRSREGLVETDPNSRVEVPEECYTELALLRSELEELENTRREIGRLTQQVHNLVSVCNSAENRAKEKRQNLSKKVGLEGGGRWAIDFDSRSFLRILPGAPNVV